ncbi:MAG: DUF4214 domain-containing protein [Candidatus Caenarcaniphilales bacterium]|nr:DUF4214 domain-containing protein [Candidatus Caenarcaniphilales bacterium]
MLYNKVLGRDSDSGGKEYWQGRLNNGESLRQITEGLLNSDEYKNQPA